MYSNKGTSEQIHVKSISWGLNFDLKKPEPPDRKVVFLPLNHNGAKKELQRHQMLNAEARFEKGTLSTFSSVNFIRI